MMMTDTNTLDQAFSAWQETRLEELNNDDSGNRQPHFDEKILLRLADRGGLESAATIELEHLENCPLCLAEWAAWRRAFSAADECSENSSADDLNSEFFAHQAFGYLEAAASATTKMQALTLESNCGTYRLEILPDRQENNAGMIILNRLTENQDTATKVTVRDRAGRIVISGPLENNRLVRIHKNLDELDFSIWTVG